MGLFDNSKGDVKAIVKKPRIREDSPNVVFDIPPKKIRKLTLEEYNDLDAILRKHNHGKNAINRVEVMKIIHERCVI